MDILRGKGSACARLVRRTVSQVELASLATPVNSSEAVQVFWKKIFSEK